MKAALLPATLLFALSSRLFALSATSPGAHHWYDLYPRVVSTKRVMVTVAARPNPTQLVVYVDDKGYLLLTAYEPMPKHFSYAQVLDLEVELLLNDASGRKDIGFALVPPAGSAWRIPIKSARLCSSALSM